MEILREILLRLLDFLASYAQWWARAVEAISEEFGLGLTPLIVDLIGFVFGALVLLQFFRVLTNWNRRGNKPQPFPLKTTETPDEVVARDRQNFLLMVLRIVLFVLFVVAVGTSR